MSSLLARIIVALRKILLKIIIDYEQYNEYVFENYGFPEIMLLKHLYSLEKICTVDFADLW